MTEPRYRDSDPQQGTPQLEVQVGQRRWMAAPDQPCVVGRGWQEELSSDPLVSRDHVIFRWEGNQFVAQDQSRNGTFCEGSPIDRIVLDRPLRLRLGNPSTGVTVDVVPRGVPGGGGERHADPVEPDLTPGSPGGDPPAQRRGLRPGPAAKKTTAGPAAKKTTVGRDEPSRRHRSAGGAGFPDAVSDNTGESLIGANFSGVHQVIKERITIGRRPDNDVVIDDLLASRRHAELRHGDDGWVVVDLGSHNGTYLSGKRITGEAKVGPEDLIGIGHQSFRLIGNELQEYEDTGDGAFQALELVVKIEGRRLLDKVSFALPPRSLLAIIGPSGAGKSTLLSALTGFRPADEGHVSYGGLDLYKNYSDLRQRIGLVPQQDILHTQLTVRTALRYAAKLRFPQDVDRYDRMERIEEVLQTLGLSGQAKQRIDTLSGGQRKRTSVALELLTKPSLLFLDEPTSGLDPGLDKSVMNTLRDLANDGRTVVVVTHSVAHLDVCDRLLVLAQGGRVAYFGPPERALGYFQQEDFADVFLQLEQADGKEWASQFEDSADYGKFLGSQLRTSADDTEAGEFEKLPKRQSVLAQFLTLTRRYAAVVRSDRQYAIFLLALPLVLSLFVQIVPGRSGLSVRAGGLKAIGEITPLLVVLVMSGCLMGSAASVRELVKERAIYRRELTIGLSPLAYLMSKLIVLSVIVGAQAVLFTYLGLLQRKPPDAPLLIKDHGVGEVALCVMAAALASMMIGLVISALVANADRTMPLVVLVVMAQLVLSGGLISLGNKPGAQQVSWVTPARWAYAAASASVGLPDPPPIDPYWRHTEAAFRSDLGNLGILTGVAGVLTLVQLRRMRPGRRRGR